MVAGIPFSITLPVYWEDTDGGGVVYHANYLRFLERARTDWLRSLGVNQGTLQREHDRVFAIRAMTIDFRAPARLDDVLRVQVDAVEIGRASLDFIQSVHCLGEGAEARLLLNATVKAACLVASSFRPVAIPEILRGRLQAA